MCLRRKEDSVVLVLKSIAFEMIMFSLSLMKAFSH